MFLNSKNSVHHGYICDLHHLGACSGGWTVWVGKTAHQNDITLVISGWVNRKHISVSKHGLLFLFVCYCSFVQAFGGLINLYSFSQRTLNSAHEPLSLSLHSETLSDVKDNRDNTDKLNLRFTKSIISRGKWLGLGPPVPGARAYLAVKIFLFSKHLKIIKS